MASRESFGKIGSDDDWEEIADNYSVKSLSSDDEEDEKPAASPVPTRSKVDSSPRSQTSPTRHAPQVTASHDANDANTSDLGHALSKMDIGTQFAPRPTSPVSVDKVAAVKTTSASKSKAPLPPSQQDELGSRKQLTMGEVTSAPLKNLNSQESGPRKVAKGAARIGDMSFEGFTEQERKPKEMVSQCGASFGASTHDTAPGSLGDTLDLDETSTDPIVIDNALQSLSRMLRDTSPALCIMHLKHATKVLPACKSLLAQVDSLTPILAGYAAKCNQPTTTARDVPLDASLMMWIASLSRTLWEIGFEFKIVESNNPGSSSPKRAPSLETLVGELESAAKQMDEFLPIIQADFAEFQKKPMYVFPGITAAPAPKYEIETPNDYQRPRIRQTMYGLKKELQHAISILKDCQRWLPDAAKVIVGDVTNGMGILFDVVGGIMASNGPAWIEGLTSETGRPRLINYSEFGNLDPIVIEDYSARIQQICGLVHIDAAESRTWSEEMIREHHVCMLIEQQQIDSLEHIVSVLKGMLLR
ncbi:hypothetical protein K4K60_005562 [Colletotrichum sp. SAR11_57]|nr:hypothetical protein K4K60_005562 [Colletotrichum sp. SAR11_57]